MFYPYFKSREHRLLAQCTMLFDVPHFLFNRIMRFYYTLRESGMMMQVNVALVARRSFILIIVYFVSERRERETCLQVLYAHYFVVSYCDGTG